MTKYNKNLFRKDLFLFQTIGNKKYKIFSSWFLTSEKGSPILKTTLDLLYEYWRTNNKLNKYFLLHYYLNISFEKYKKDFNKVLKYSRDLCHIMQKILFDPFNLSVYNKIIKQASIHKLTYRFKKYKNFRNNSKKNSFYHYILKEYS